MCVRGLVGACVCAWACACEHVCACGRTCLHTRTRVFPKRPLHPHGRRPALAAPTLAMQAPDVRVQVPCTRAHAWAQAPGPQDRAAHRRDLPGHCGRKSSRTAADCQSLLRPAAPPSALRARTLLPGGGSTLRAPPCRRCAGHCHGTLRPSTIRGRGRGAALRRGPRPARRPGARWRTIFLGAHLDANPRSPRVPRAQARGNQGRIARAPRPPVYCRTYLSQRAPPRRRSPPLCASTHLSAVNRRLTPCVETPHTANLNGEGFPHPQNLFLPSPQILKYCDFGTFEVIFGLRSEKRGETKPSHAREIWLGLGRRQAS